MEKYWGFYSVHTWVDHRRSAEKIGIGELKVFEQTDTTWKIQNSKKMKQAAIVRDG
jgi:hypothetical protein